MAAQKGQQRQRASSIRMQLPHRGQAMLSVQLWGLSKIELQQYRERQRVSSVSMQLAPTHTCLIACGRARSCWLGI